MSTEVDRPAAPIIPRPEVVKTLGVLNIAVSTVMGLCLLVSVLWCIAIVASKANRPRPDPVATAAPGRNPAVESSTLMGIDIPEFLRFAAIDAASGLVLNALMFATGIGLVNLRSWGARWWTWLAGAKIVRLVVVWGGFIVAVIPALSDGMGRYVIGTMPFPQGRGPTLADLTKIYAVANLILAVSMIALGSIYPAISLWLLGRPGVRASLAMGTRKESYLP